MRTPAYLTHSADGSSAYLLAPPALGEGRHRGLACRLMAVGGRAILVLPEEQRPHPRRSHWRSVNLEDAADNGATIGKHVINPRRSIRRT